jgi:DNA-binding IclR family transcriptional regulator
VVYLERIRGHRSGIISSRVGGRLPAYCTGVGKAMLAFAPDAAMTVMAGRLEARTPYTITDHQLFAEELHRIRKNGVSYDREENQIGVNCAAAPIMVGGSPIAAVSVTSTSSRVEVERFSSAVKAAALGIQRVLSRTPGTVVEVRSRKEPAR